MGKKGNVFEIDSDALDPIKESSSTRVYKIRGEVISILDAHKEYVVKKYPMMESDFNRLKKKFPQSVTLDFGTFCIYAVQEIAKKVHTELPEEVGYFVGKKNEFLSTYFYQTFYETFSELTCRQIERIVRQDGYQLFRIPSGKYIFADWDRTLRYLLDKIQDQDSLKLTCKKDVEGYIKRFLKI